MRFRNFENLEKRSTPDFFCVVVLIFCPPDLEAEREMWRFSFKMGPIGFSNAPNIREREVQPSLLRSFLDEGQGATEYINIAASILIN